MRRYWALAVWSLAAVVAGAAGADEHLLKGVRGPNTLKGVYYLGMVKGKVRLVQMSRDRMNWKFANTFSGTLIRQGEGGKYGGWYLSYDAKGKSKEVFLSKKPTAGSYWWVGHNVTEENLPFTRTFSAAAGKLKGWRLGAGTKAEMRKGYQHKKFWAYKAVLLNNPKPVPRYYVFSIAP
jgi:hypothetical protein